MHKARAAGGAYRHCAQKKQWLRFVVTIDPIGKSVAVDVDGADLEVLRYATSIRSGTPAESQPT